MYLSKRGVLRLHGDRSVSVRDGPFGVEQECTDCGLVVYEDNGEVADWIRAWGLPTPRVLTEPHLPDNMVLRRLELQRVDEVARSIVASDSLRRVLECVHPVAQRYFSDDLRRAAHALLTRARDLTTHLSEITTSDLTKHALDDRLEDDARVRLGIYELVLNVDPIGADLLAATMRYIARIEVRQPA